MSVRGVLSESAAWVRRNWVRTLLFSVASFLICWMWNIWLMARAAGGGGYADVGLTDSVATAPGSNRFNGLYWLLISSIGFGLFTYGRERGFVNALGDIARLPGNFARSVSTNPVAGISMLLWGMVVGLGAGGFMPSAVSAVLGAGLLLLALTPVAAILNNIVIRLFTGITQSAAPGVSDLLSGMAAPFLVMAGEVVGLLLSNFAGLSALPALGLALACGAGAWFLGVSAAKSAPAPPPAAFLILLVAGFAVFGPAHPTRAAADDGGWSECFDEDTGEPCRGLSGFRVWWSSPGASVARAEARAGGYYGAFGAVVGAVLGGVLGAAAKQRNGWRLPGGGFNTHPVSVTGHDALVELHHRGFLDRGEDGTYRWAQGSGPRQAEASMRRSDLGGGKAARVAVSGEVDPDGAIRADSLRIDAEVVNAPKSGASAALPSELHGAVADPAMPFADVLPAEDRFDEDEEEEEEDEDDRGGG